MGLLWNDQAPFLEDPKSFKGGRQDRLQSDPFEFLPNHSAKWKA